MTIPASSEARWMVVVPFKGAPRAKSRLAERFDDRTRAMLARAFLADTIAAISAVPGVALLVVVSSEAGLEELLTPIDTEIVVVADPGAGLNPAISAGIDYARARDAGAFIAALTGDLPSLRGRDLKAALDEAVLASRGGRPLTLVTDHGGEGTTTITVAPGAVLTPRFGLGSRAAHEAAGHLLLPIPPESSLRHDVDSPGDLDAIEPHELGPATRAVLIPESKR